MLANDIDPDPNPGLQVTETTMAGTYGSVTIQPDGGWSYVLDDSDSDTDALAQGDIAFDQFTYTVADAIGATDTATLTIQITGRNDAPVAEDDLIDFGPGGTVSLGFAPDTNLSDYQGYSFEGVSSGGDSIAGNTPDPAARRRRRLLPGFGERARPPHKPGGGGQLQGRRAAGR